MACKSGSVQKAEKKSGEALNAIKALQLKMEKLAQEKENEFQQKINLKSQELNVNDFLILNSASNVKIEFTHEFNVDALVPIISTALKIAASAIAGGGSSVLATLLKSENLDLFSSLLGGISDSLKTVSNSSANVLFSMNRLAPGFFAFISVRSETIYDKDTFGEESITAASYLYAFGYSEKHASEVTDIKETIALIEIINRYNDALVGLVDKLIGNAVTLSTCENLSKLYKAERDEAKTELAKLIGHEPVVEVKKNIPASIFKFNNKISYQDVVPESLYSIMKGKDPKDILSNAIKTLSKRSPSYQMALQDAKEILLEI